MKKTIAKHLCLSNLFLLFSTSALLFLSCERDTKGIEYELVSLSNDTIITENSVIRIDLDLIKESASKGMTSFDMSELYDSHENLKIIPAELSDELIKVKVGGNPEWHLNYDLESNPLLYYQWEENKDYFWFSILKMDAVCCLTMYMGITNIKGELLSLNCVAIYGGDGGWSQNDTGEKLYLGTYVIESISEQSEDILENEKWIVNTMFEHTILKVSLKNGKFERDTLSYIESDTTYYSN